MYLVVFLLATRKRIVVPIRWVMGFQVHLAKFLNNGLNRNQIYHGIQPKSGGWERRPRWRVWTGLRWFFFSQQFSWGRFIWMPPSKLPMWVSICIFRIMTMAWVFYPIAVFHSCHIFTSKTLIWQWNIYMKWTHPMNPFHLCADCWT